MISRFERVWNASFTRPDGKSRLLLRRRSFCRGCALLTQCVGSEQRHRTIVVGENHDLLHACRIEQKSEAFKERMHQRNRIEGTISELTRVHGMRRNRYRGL